MSKKEVLENQEKNESAEIEALFKKVEKTPHGEILVSTFKENTFIESRKLVVESRRFPYKKIMGAIKEEEMYLPHTHKMVLSVTPDMFNKDEVELKIFDNADDAEIDYNPSIEFFIDKRCDIGCIVHRDLSLFSLFDDIKQTDSKRLFIRIIDEVRSKGLQTARVISSANRPTPTLI